MQKKSQPSPGPYSLRFIPEIPRMLIVDAKGIPIAEILTTKGIDAGTFIENCELFAECWRDDSSDKKDI